MILSFHRSVQFHFRIALFHSFAFVKSLFTLGQGYFQFGKAAFANEKCKRD